MLTSDFDYDLPDESIAQSAIEPRDASRLLVTKTLEDHVFSELPFLLNEGDLVVVNRTRVRAARVEGTKIDTGGKVELLLTRRIDDELWQALVRPARRVQPGTKVAVGSILGEVIAGPDRGVVTIRLEPPDDVEDVLNEIGEVPLPPYFHGELASPDRYQTMFATDVGSAAAPTAALHFTPELVSSLDARDIGIATVDLAVGLDTFRPMADGAVEDHVMHSEAFDVPAATVSAVAEARVRGGRIVAVGTTVLRSLETAAKSGVLLPTAGDTELFITPGYEPRIVDRLVTNFHAPRTTLLALVAAFLGDRWREVYGTALERGYRFLSFGDAMLIEVPRA